MIVLDAETGVIDLEVNAEELEARAKDWTARKSPFQSGYLWKYANEVGPARTGAVTHPGGSAETVCYADV
jgi:dihydroxy-acid dehydratase